MDHRVKPGDDDLGMTALCGAAQARLCPTCKTQSGECSFYRPEPLQFHPHLVPGLEPHRLDEAPGQHDLAGAQAFAIGGEMIGEPGECVVRMAEDVGAGAPPCLVAVDYRAADHAEQ